MNNQVTLEAPVTGAHTPGPWDAFGPIIHRNGRHIAHVEATGIGDGERGTPEQRANARLIAAAPDLLAALKLLLTAELPADGLSRKIETGRRAMGLAAIDKAEGRGE
jgi:hypothetical protein